MQNSNSNAGAEVPQSTEAEPTTSSQTIAKPNVGSSIFYVSGTLDKTGFRHRVDKLCVAEKSKCFVGEGKRISKDKLMKLDTIFLDNHKAFRFHTYCLDGHQQEALKLIKNAIIEKVAKVKTEFDAVSKWV